MKVYGVIFVALILALSCNESMQQRPSRRGPTGRRFSSGRGDSALKSIQQAEQQQLQQAEPQEFYRSLDVDDNPCSKDNEAEIQKAFTQLMLLGDRDILLSRNTGHHDEHCDEGKRNLKTYLNHVKCFKGKVRDNLELLGDGFTKWVNKRCTSQKWHDKFIKLSSCFKNADVQHQWHSCNDRNVAAYRYVVENVAPRNQLDGFCCTLVHADRCQHNVTDEACGPRVADVAIEVVWEPWEVSIEKWCTGKYDCSRSLPEASKEIKLIYGSEVPVAAEGGFYKYFSKIVKNTFGDVDDYFFVT